MRAEPSSDTVHEPSTLRAMAVRLAVLVGWSAVPAGQVSRLTDWAVGAQRVKPTRPAPEKLGP